MSLSRRLALALCAASTAWCAPALADVEARAQLGSFGYMLADLDPNDGIAPALTFTPHWWEQHSGTLSMSYSEEETPWNGRTLFYEFRNRSDDKGGDLGVEYRWEDSSTSTSLSGRATPSQQLLSFDAYLPAGGVYRTVEQSIEADPIAFTLTPNTAVTFFAKMDVTGSLGPGDYNYFHSRGRLDVYVNGAWNQPAPFEAFAQANMYVPELERTVDLFVSYAHQSREATNGAINLSLFSDVRSIAPVPEPSQAALFAGGALLLAAAGARRRRRS